MSSRHPIDRPARVVASRRVLNHRRIGWSGGKSWPSSQRGCGSILTCSKTPLPGFKCLYHSRGISLCGQGAVPQSSSVLVDLLVENWPGLHAPQPGPQIDEVPWLLLTEEPETLEIGGNVEANIPTYPSYCFSQKLTQREQDKTAHIGG